MLFKLFKVPYVFTDEKGIQRTNYNFYIVSENGNVMKILPNSYQDDKKNYHSNRKELSLLASLCDDKGEIKF